MTRSRSNPSRLGLTLTRLSLDSPQVIASRTLRFMQPGVLQSAAGQSEFWRLIVEKQAAATESYFSLLMSAAALSQRMFLGPWAAWARGQTPGTGLLTANAAAKTTNDALKPFQRRARANVRRLGRPGKLR